MKEFKTAKGTTLQLMELKGKDYMMVNQRLIWFREEKPTWTIETTVHTLTPDTAIFRAAIKDDSGLSVATAHKQENKKDFSDYIEKAETGAVGRALLFCGYGTSFAANELDEKERLVDSPVSQTVSVPIYEERDPAPQQVFDTVTKPKVTPKPPLTTKVDPNYVMRIGKYKDKKLNEVGRTALSGYIKYMQSGTPPLTGKLKEDLDIASNYLRSTSGN